MSKKHDTTIEDFQFAALQEVEDVLQEVIDELRPYFLGSVRRFLDRHPQSKEGWIAIVSLSSLRSEVGGRFETLRDYWTKAGLPFRAHRGDGGDRYTLDEQGWIELCQWLAKKGYQVKPDGDDDRTLFSIRRVDF